jgi:hypothetical protein
MALSFHYHYTRLIPRQSWREEQKALIVSLDPVSCVPVSVSTTITITFFTGCERSEPVEKVYKNFGSTELASLAASKKEIVIVTVTV